MGSNVCPVTRSGRFISDFKLLVVSNWIQVKLPSDYYFGITAASADVPDSFEAYKFVVTTSSSIAREEPRRGQIPLQDNQQQQQQQQQGRLPLQGYQQQQLFQDTPASQYKSQDAQFEDLHNKIQIIAHSLDSLAQQVSKLAQNSEGRHAEISRNVMSADQLNAMDQRIQGIEKTVKDYQGEFTRMHRVFESSHSNMMQNLPAQMTESKSYHSHPRSYSWLIPVSHTYKVTSHGCLPLPNNSLPGLVGWVICTVQTKAGEWTEEIPVNVCSIAATEHPVNCTVMPLAFQFS